MLSARSTRSRGSARSTRSTRRRTVRSTHVLRSGSRYTTRRQLLVNDGDDADDERADVPSDSDRVVESVSEELSVEEEEEEEVSGPGEDDEPDNNEEDEEEEEEGDLDVAEVDASDGDDEGDNKGEEGSDDDGDTTSDTGGSSSGVDLASDTSGSGVTDSEALAYTPPPPGGYVPHHHWDTRLSAKFKRYKEASSARARTHWSGLRTRLVGHKSPLARLAGVVRNLLSPSGTGNAAAAPQSSPLAGDNDVVDDDAELNQRLFANAHSSPTRAVRGSPAASPMVLTISSKPRHPCVRCCALWGRPLATLCGLLFMLLLAWLLLAVVPGLYEQPLLSPADRRDMSGGCDVGTMERITEASARRTHAYVDAQVAGCAGKCDTGLVAAAKNLTEIKLLMEAFRQQHDGDMSSTNSSVTAVRDALLDRIMNLDAEVGKMLARIASLEVQSKDAMDGLSEVAAQLKQLQRDLQEVVATVADIPNTHPSYDWVKEYVEKEVANVLQRQQSTSEALRVDDKEALSANLKQIAESARSALDKADAATDAAATAQGTATEALERAAAAQEAVENANSGVSTLAPAVEAATVTANAAADTAGKAMTAAQDAKDAADAAADVAQQAATAADDAQTAADGAREAAAADAAQRIADAAEAGANADAATIAQLARDEAAIALQEAQKAQKDIDAVKETADAAYYASGDAGEAAAQAAQVAADAKEMGAEAVEKADEALAAAQAQPVAMVDAAAGLSEDRARELVKEAMEAIAADGGAAMPDYALKSAGASVAYEGNLLSKTFEPTPTMVEKVLCMVGLVPHRGQSPHDAIESSLDVGKCWPMAGSSGRFTVRLSDPGGVMPTHFTVDHAHHSVAHSLASAPRGCEVWGYRTVDDESPLQLASFEYDVHGAASQTFERTMNQDNTETFPLMQLRILGNWGNPYHTCLYRFRVHGKPAHPGAAVAE